MKMKIKVVKLTSNADEDNRIVAEAFADLVAQGYDANNITKDSVTSFHYDAYSAGGSAEHLDDVAVLVAKA